MVSQTFTNDDVFRGMEFTKKLQLDPMKERRLTQEETVEKYHGLKNLKMFLERMQNVMYTDALPMDSGK